MSPVTLPAHRHGVFGLDDIAALGLTRSALRHGLATGQLQRLRTGVYWQVTALPEDRYERRRERHRIHCVGLALQLPQVTISHGSAAVMQDLPVLELPSTPIATTARRRASQLRSAHLHHAALPSPHRRGLGDVEVTSSARSAVDIAREQGVRAGLITADAALHTGLCTREELRAVRDACQGWPGTRQADQLVELADGRSESPLESLSRFDLRTLLIPPEPQAWIFHLDGRFIGRVDFFWPEFGVVGEVDGLSKYTGPSILVEEKLRQERLEQVGLEVVRWVASDLKNLPRLQHRLMSAAARYATGHRPRSWRAELSSRI